MLKPDEAALTRRKIHEASEMEPKTPDRASRAVNGTPCNMIAGIAALWNREECYRNQSNMVTLQE